MLSTFVFVQFIMKKWTTASAITIQWQYYTIMLIFFINAEILWGWWRICTYSKEGVILHPV